MNRRVFALALVALISLTGLAQARAPQPTKFMKAQVNTVRELLKVKVTAGTPEAAEHDKKLMAIIEPVMEFEGLSQRALRKHWPTLNETQRSTFVSLFKELVFRSYLKRVRSADEAYTIKYEDEEEKGDKATVTAIAKTKKAEIELVFKLEAREGKRWVAADIVIDEVSLEENYREQFNKIIAEEGFEKLLDKMRKKLEDLKK